MMGTSSGVDVGYQINTKNDSTNWVRMLHVKDISIDAIYVDMQNVSLEGMAHSKGVLGDDYGVTASLDMSLLRTGKVEITASPGIGIVYITQTFYTIYNPVVGSHINAVVQLRLKIKVSISDELAVEGGCGIPHFSNASFQTPNDGINNPTVFFGLVKRIHSTGLKNHVEQYDDNENKSSFDFTFSIGKRGLTRLGYFINQKTGQPMYLDTAVAQTKERSMLYQLAASLAYKYHINDVFALKIATDLLYYTKTFSWDNFFNTYQGQFSSYDHVSAGVSVGGDIRLGRTTFTASYGRYVHYNAVYPTKYYWSCGVAYNITPSVAATVNVRMQRYEPHYPSFGVIFSIGNHILKHN